MVMLYIEQNVHVLLDDSQELFKLLCSVSVWMSRDSLKSCRWGVFLASFVWCCDYFCRRFPSCDSSLLCVADYFIWTEVTFIGLWEKRFLFNILLHFS